MLLTIQLRALKREVPRNFLLFTKSKKLSFFSNNNIGLISKVVDMTSVDEYTSAYFKNQGNKYVKVHIEDIHLIKKDLDMLNNGERVYDQIINANFRLLIGKYSNVQAVNTFFMTKIG